jgi:hypothetical protein
MQYFLTCERRVVDDEKVDLPKTGSKALALSEMVEV